LVFSPPPLSVNLAALCGEKPKKKGSSPVESIHVKATSEDGKIAFAEQNEAHPDGEATVMGDGEVVKVARTPAVEQAILDGNLIQVKDPMLPSDTVSATTETVETETFGEPDEDA
jgi:hypothetical protein